MVRDSANTRRSAKTAPAPVVPTDEPGHAEFVDAWLQQSEAARLPREALVDLFERALHGLWMRTSTTLGEVTLTAISDRVLHNAAERLPAFASLRVEPSGRIHARELRDTVASVHHLKLLDGMRALLIEFLTVLGNLTAELLTPELHAELTNAFVNGNGTGASPRLAAKRMPEEEEKENG